MRTTLDLPEPMFRRLKSTAALRGTSMKALIIEVLERELGEQNTTPADEPFPVIRSRKPGHLQLDPDRMAEMLEGEDVIDIA